MSQPVGQCIVFIKVCDGRRADNAEIRVDHPHVVQRLRAFALHRLHQCVAVEERRGQFIGGYDLSSLVDEKIAAVVPIAPCDIAVAAIGYFPVSAIFGRNHKRSRTIDEPPFLHIVFLYLHRSQALAERPRRGKLRLDCHISLRVDVAPFPVGIAVMGAQALAQRACSVRHADAARLSQIRIDFLSGRVDVDPHVASWRFLLQPRNAVKELRPVVVFGRKLLDSPVAIKDAERVLRAHFLLAAHEADAIVELRRSKIADCFPNVIEKHCAVFIEKRHIAIFRRHAENAVVHIRDTGIFRYFQKFRIVGDADSIK